MNGFVVRDALRTGDVFLSLGKGRLSELINLLDGGKYSHASIYDGECVIECVAEGVRRHTIEELFEHRVFVDVYRFRSDAGEYMNDAGWPLQPVLDAGGKYLAQGTKYAYNQLLMMGLLIVARRTPIPRELSEAARTYMDHALKLLADLTDNSREPLTCSEFAYRCFYEAVPQHQYGLTIPGVLDPSHFTNAAIQGSRTPDLELEESLDDAQALAALSNEFARRYARLKPNLSEPNSQDFELEQANPNVVPDFVSPGDLQRSPNLEYLGNLEFPAEP